MKRVWTIIGTVALLSGIAYGIYWWALDGKGPTAKELIRRQLMKVIDEADVLVNNARQSVDKFNTMVGELGRTAARTGYHAQSLAEKEIKARHSMELLVSELKYIENTLKKAEPLRYTDGSVLSPEETELRVMALGESLAASRELLATITQEKLFYEKLHQEQMKSIRLAPSHRQVLQVRLVSLETSLRFYRERQERLDQDLAGTDLYTALYEEAKAAIGEAKAVITPAVITMDTSVNGMREILKSSNDESVSSSNAAADRALEKINALLASSK